MCVRKGFFAALVGLVGNLLTLLLALVLSNPIAEFIFEKFLRGGVITQVETALDTTLPMQSVEVFVQGFVDSLPSSLTAHTTDTIINNRLSTLFNSATEATADTVVELAVQPIMVSIMSAITFLFLMFVIGFVIQLLERFVAKLNLIPIAGPINRVLGGVLGVVPGAVNCILLYCLLVLIAAFTNNIIPVINEQAMVQSISGGLFFNLLESIAGVFAL